MKNIFIWLHQKFPKRRRISKDEVDELIDKHKEITQKADAALTKAIAALDGETGWWTCRCDEKGKECPHDTDHRTP